MLRTYSLAAGVCLAALLASQQAAAQQAAAQQSSPQASPDAIAPPTDQAEATSAGEQNTGLADIIVTAQKRAENLQKVPIAISAVGTERLAEAGIQSTQGLAAVLPGLQLLNVGDSVTPRVRGVGSSFTAAGLESPVATYVDGVYLAFGADVNMELFDVEQVSLIKGPQGTLFGRNATGGVLQITTRQPEHEFSGRARLSYDNYETIKGDLFVTGGLSDTVAASLAASYTHQGKGWGRNFATGNETYKTDHNYSLRGKVKADLSETTTVRLSADYMNRAGTMAGAFRPFPGTSTAYPSPQPRRLWDSNSNSDPALRYRGGGGSLTIDQEIGTLRLTSISAYRDSRQFFHFNAVPTATPVFDINVIDASRQFTQELQLASSNTGRLTWQAGAFYFHNIARRAPDFFFAPGFAATLAQLATGDPANGPAIFPFVKESISGRQNLDSLAGYAQATYKITDATRLTAGFRYTWQWTKFAGTDTVFLPDGTAVPAVSNLGTKASFQKPTWRLSLDHDFAPAVTGYVSYNRGVKSGGFNLSNPANLFYQPERLDAYEAGVKSQFLDRRVRLNASGFFYNYANIQVPAFSSVTVIKNGAAAHLYGADVDLLAKVTDRLILDAGVNWLHARFQSFPGASFTNPLPNGQPGLGLQGDASGNTIPYSPSLTYAIGATYTVRSTAGNVALNVNDNYNSGFYTEADNYLRQRAYHFLNGSVSWTLPGDRLTARIYVSNILNKAVVSQAATVNGYAYIADYTNPPRIFGGSLELKF